MKPETLVKAGGIFHMLCAVFHLLKPGMVKWGKKLENIPADVKSVLIKDLHLMNICILLFWLILAFIPFFYSGDLLNTGIGKSVLGAIVVFWTVRLFILQPVLAGFRSKFSVFQTLFFVIGFLCFLIPFIAVLLNRI